MRFNIEFLVIFRQTFRKECLKNAKAIAKEGDLTIYCPDTFDGTVLMFSCGVPYLINPPQTHLFLFQYPKYSADGRL